MVYSNAFFPCLSGLNTHAEIETPGGIPRSFFEGQPKVLGIDFSVTLSSIRNAQVPHPRPSWGVVHTKSDGRMVNNKPNNNRNQVVELN